MNHRLILLLLLVAMLIPSGGAQAQSSGLVYEVQSGDTLSKIAERFGTSVSALMAANGLIDASIIQPGWRLLIPGYPGVTGELHSVQVELGENLRSLSLRYGIPEQVLIRLNHIVNPDRVFAGQNLVLPESGAAAIRVPNASMVLPGGGSGLLQLSIQENSNPWTLTTAQGAPRLWVVPGEAVPIPGGDEPTSALPMPIRALLVEPDPAVQGRTMVFRISLETAGWVSGRLGETPLTFNPIDTMTWVALQGVHALAEPGLIDLEINLRADQDGEISYAFSQPIRLIEGGYPFDPVLIVPRETLDPAITDPEDEMVRQIVNQVSRERLFNGVFSFPAGETSAFPSLFGSRRNYNDTGYTRYHSGLDFYAATGDPIFASAAGRVVLTEDLIVRGLSTIIDHGWGVFTLYLHQSEILVSVGETVMAGDLIGRVGASGRSTGAHLHWEVTVGGVPVDPLEWTQAAFP